MADFPPSFRRYDQLPIPEKAVAITLDAQIGTSVTCVGLWVGAAGAVAVTFWDDSTVVYVGVPAGTTLWGRFKNVLTSGTTVASPTSNILALLMGG